MAGTLFSDLYDLVRVATGNDDPTIGPEILPDTRIDVLLTSAALTITSYSLDFPPLAVDVTTASPTIFVSGDATESALDPHLVTALAHIVAHKYFVGINNQSGISVSSGIINLAAEGFVGSGATTIQANEGDLSSAIIYMTRKRNEALAQKNLR